RPGEDARHRRDRRRLVRRELEADAYILARAEKVIDDIEALLAVRIVDPAHVDDAHEGETRIVAQEADKLHDLGGHHRQRQLAIGDRRLDDRVTALRADILGDFLKGL